MPRVQLTLPAAHKLRPLCTLHDADGRGYLAVSAADQATYSLPKKQGWWWCVLPYGRPGLPRVGGHVRGRVIYKIALGFARGRTVGVVGLR